MARQWACFTKHEWQFLASWQAIWVAIAGLLARRRRCLKLYSVSSTYIFSRHSDFVVIRKYLNFIYLVHCQGKNWFLWANTLQIRWMMSQIIKCAIHEPWLFRIWAGSLTIENQIPPLDLGGKDIRYLNHCNNWLLKWRHSLLFRHCRNKGLFKYWTVEIVKPYDYQKNFWST